MDRPLGRPDRRRSAETLSGIDDLSTALLRRRYDREGGCGLADLIDRDVADPRRVAVRERIGQGLPALIDVDVRVDHERPVEDPEVRRFACRELGLGRLLLDGSEAVRGGTLESMHFAP